MAIRPLAVFALATTSLLCQDAAPAVPSAPALPAAGSAAATALVDKAIAAMKAHGSGTFATTEARDDAMLRGQGLPFGNEETAVSGGWQHHLVWGDSDGKQYLRANGRMVAKVDGAWKLRGKKLAGGQPAPFTLDPDLLFTVLGDLPAEARKVVHVDAAEVGGKKVAVLSLALEKAVASEFADSGAVPSGGGGFGGMMFMPGGGEVPENEYTAYVALFVDLDSGDLLRFSTKVYEKNEMMGHVQIQVAGAGGGEEGDEEKEEKEEKAEKGEKGEKGEAAGGAPTWKKGLPNKKPAKDESVTTFRADFKKLGAAEPPALDDKAKTLLRLAAEVRKR